MVRGERPIYTSTEVMAKVKVLMQEKANTDTGDMTKIKGHSSRRA